MCAGTGRSLRPVSFADSPVPILPTVPTPIRITTWLAGLLLLIALLLGGGQGGVGDVLAQECSLGLLAWLGWQATQGDLSWRGPRWLPLLPLTLPILQLLPWPEMVWAAGPARQQLLAQLAGSGVRHGAALSLNTSATERGLWSLLPACALYLTALALPRSRQRLLLVLLLGLSLLSVFWGMAQLAGGQDSPLRLYSPTNPTEAVGFFANRNHLAGLLLMTLPVALAGTAWAINERLAGRPLPVFWAIAGATTTILLILGLALARSRAGLLLGMLAVLASFPIVLNLRRVRGMKRILAVTLGLAVMLSVQFALLGIVQRLDKDPLDDGRWQYAQITREAATAYAPWGSGLGTFRQAYQPFEAKHNPDRAIVNHAHNDYLELWLEGGYPALVLLGLGGLMWGGCTLRLWRRSPDPGTPESRDRLVARAAWLSVTLALLHSALDYPLRTTANMSVFAVLVAIAFTEATRRSPVEADRRDLLETGKE